MWLLLSIALVLGACSPPAKPPATSAEKRYPLTGEVVSVDRQAQTARVRHDAIRGWMEPMTMEFPVTDKAELDKIKPGDRISGTVFVRDLDYKLGEIQVRQ